MANIGTDILGLPTVTGLSGGEYVPLVQGGTTKRATVSQIGFGTVTEIFPAGIDYVMMGGTEIVPLGVQGTGLVVPFDMEVSQFILTGSDLAGGAAGSVVVDIWKCTQSDYDGGATHPVVGDSITGSNIPTITNGTITVDTPSGWTAVTLTEGDILWYNINSVAIFRSVTLALRCSRILP